MKILYLLVIVLIFNSCKQESENSKINKDENTSNNELDSSMNKSDALSFLSSPVQIFEINPGKRAKVIGEFGTELYFEPNCFIESPRKVIIELREYFSVTNMLLANLSTCSDTTLLESDGMIYFSAYDENNNLLHLKAPVLVKMPTDSLKQGFNLYSGDTIHKTVNWKESDTKLISDDIWYSFDYNDIDSMDDKTNSMNESQNLFRTSGYGWVNVDRILNPKEKTDLIVNLTDDDDNIFYTLVLEKYNSLIPCFKDKDKMQINFRDIPKNEKATIVAIKVTQDSSIHYNFLDINTIENFSKFPTLLPINKNELRSKFDKKFGKDIWSRPSL